MSCSPRCGVCGARLVADDATCPGCLLDLAVDASPETAIPDDAPGIAAGHDRIGGYRILEVLGEGGMGIVYLAEQSSPIRRRVALKLVKPGLESAHVMARFETERQALALMSHANVARVFDAGIADDGRPYFVMEHVPGTPIVEFSDRRQLAIDERLELFLQACAALLHAHQKGITIVTSSPRICSCASRTTGQS